VYTTVFLIASNASIPLKIFVQVAYKASFSFLRRDA